VKKTNSENWSSNKFSLFLLWAWRFSRTRCWTSVASGGSRFLSRNCQSGKFLFNGSVSSGVGVVGAAEGGVGMEVGAGNFGSLCLWSGGASDGTE